MLSFRSVVAVLLGLLASKGINMAYYGFRFWAFGV